ncbi:hypothetical protein NDU88_003161 [Pleurodeles waltl]|uniref:Storkhead-box protein 1 n=1 Tax=Pleurodeles waltl TaxID=8319 RepID=A0AAV7WN96_PLEWA|nr:hypothetical protein NDU88_003161 [Pleurodeles waltl]
MSRPKAPAPMITEERCDMRKGRWVRGGRSSALSHGLSRKRERSSAPRLQFEVFMPQQMDKLLQIAPHSLAVVLSHPDDASHMLVVDERLQQHRLGYDIFANFKAENMQHFWNKRVTEAIAETFFLGWIDEHVLLIQGKEEHLGALREGWVRRALRPPQGFAIKYLGKVRSLAARTVPRLV